MWTQPSFAPQTYEGYCQCQRLCEKMYDPVIKNSSILSPYTFTGINPGTYCIVGLNGIFGSDQASLTSAFITTLSSGKLCYIIIFIIIILF